MISESEYLPKGHGVHTAFLNTVKMLREKKVDVLINSFKRADITHIHTVGPFAWYKLLTSKNTVVSAHVIPSSFVGSIVLSQYWLKESAAYLKFFYNESDLVLAVSDEVKKELLKIGVSKPVEVLPNPIDNKIFKKDQKLREAGRKLLGLDKEDFVILGVGQIQPRKGLETFSQAAQKLPSYKFIWIGGRPIKRLTAGIKNLDTLIKNKPRNLCFLGEAAYGRMPYYYNAADCFFFPSFQENAPMAVIEAASVGLPLVLRDLPEFRSLYRGGYLAGADKDFAAIISRLKEDEPYRRGWTKNAKNLSTRFTFDALGDKLIKYYSRLLV